MALETGTYINSLVATNPTATDPIKQGDDHLRLIKAALKATFPNITGAVTPTHTELNYVDGVTSAIQTQLNAKLASASYTAADVKAKLLTVDGAGSLVDADKLDGQEGSYYYPASNPNGYTTNVGDITGVTAGNGITGGGTTGTPTVTLGTPSSITSSSTNSVTATSHTHALSAASVGALSASLAVGAVGTYAFLGNTLSDSDNIAGDTVAGSNLRYAGILSTSPWSTDYSAGNQTGGVGSTNTPTGTWRCMGTSGATTQPYYGATLWLRIS